MVDFVDILIKRAPVKRSVRPVMPSILEYEEDGNLAGNLVPGGEGHACTKTEVQGHGMEEPGRCKTSGDMLLPSNLECEALPYLRKLDCEMRQKYESGAIPLLFVRWYFLLPWHQIRKR